MARQRCSGEELRIGRTGRGTRLPFALLALAMAMLARGPATALAQAPAHPEPAVSGTIGDARVVSLEAQVTDPRGRPVHGLARWDFTLWVDGVETPVDYLTEVRDGQAGDASLAQLAPPGPVAAGPVPTNFLVYVDGSFAVGSRLAAALRRLRTDLRLLHPADRMAVAAAGSGAHFVVLSGWSADPAELAAALDRAAAPPPAAPTAPAAPAGRQALTPSLSDRPKLANKVAGAAAAAAAAFRCLPPPRGRNVLVLLTAGWPLAIEPAAFRPLVASANLFDYAIVAVDVGRLEPGSPRSEDRLQAAAKETGGKAADASSAGLLQAAMQDAGSYYRLGFTVTRASDSRRHQLRVEAAPRRAAVLAPSGYFDRTPEAETAAAAADILRFGGDAGTGGRRSEAGPGGEPAAQQSQ
jgi:VWFA-related protein